MSVKIENVAIGPESWRNRTLRGIKMSEDIIKRSIKHASNRQSADPAPFMREFLIRLTNDEILKYFRELREVVVKLRQAVECINSEIVTMTRYQDKLHKELDFLRKDIVVNRESRRMRKTRPLAEQDRDGADDLLNAENKHLWNSKKVLEVQLRNVQDMLQTFEKSRQLLHANLHERSRALDLTNKSAVLTNQLTQKTRPTTADPRFENLQCATVCPPEACTPSCDTALKEVQDITAEAAKVRNEVDRMLSRVTKLNNAAHDSVNKGLLKKLAESTHLMQHLSMCNGQNRMALQRSQTLYDKTDWSRNHLLRDSYLTCRERYNRPLVTLFQKHAGTYLPGSTEINAANQNMLNSLAQTTHNLDLLNLSKLNLQNDLRSKSAAVKIDGDALRFRRNRASHKWPIDAHF